MPDAYSPGTRIAVGDALEFARIASGVYIEDLAEALGVNHKGYLEIVAGLRPLLFMQALRAIDLLGISAAQFVGLVDLALEPQRQGLSWSDPEIGVIYRRRLYQLLIRLEREGREGAGAARKWLEERYELDAEPADPEVSPPLDDDTTPAG